MGLPRQTMAYGQLPAILPRAGAVGVFRKAFVIFHLKNHDFPA
jgi:hypothetical protein